jgi:hypothetical protein
MISKIAFRHYLFLLIFAALAQALLLGLNAFSPGHPALKNIFGLNGGFTLIAFIALTIFFLGSAKKPEDRVFMTLVAMGVKMLLSFVLALLWFMVFKNRETGSVLLFFVLYLSFTLFVVFTFYRALK